MLRDRVLGGEWLQEQQGGRKRDQKLPAFPGTGKLDSGQAEWIHDPEDFLSSLPG